MKWYHSIITRISVIFALALLGIAAIFISLSFHDRESHVRSMHDYSHIALRSALDAPTRMLDHEKLEEMGLSLVTDEILKNTILLQPVNHVL